MIYSAIGNPFCGGCVVTTLAGTTGTLDGSALEGGVVAVAFAVDTTAGGRYCIIEKMEFLGTWKERVHVFASMVKFWTSPQTPAARINGFMPVEDLLHP